MTFKEHIKMERRALKELWQHHRTYVICMCLFFVFQAAYPYIPTYFSAEIINNLYEGAPLSTIITNVVLAVGLTFLCHGIVRFVQPRLSVAHGNTFKTEDWLYSKKAMEMEYSSIESPDVALLRSRVRQESHTGFNLWNLLRSVRSYVENITRIICSLALSISFFTSSGVPLFGKLGIVGFLVISIIVDAFCTAKNQEITNKFWDDSSVVNMMSDKYEDLINNYSYAKDTRLYSMESGILSRIKEFDTVENKREFKRSLKCMLVNIPRVLVADILKFCAYMLLIWCSIQGAMSVGDITKYVVCIVGLIGAVSGLVKYIHLSFLNHTYLERYFSYFDIPNNMYQGSLTVEKRMDNEYYVEFRNVSFKYPNTDTYALKNVNVKFKIGEKLAVVGMNGSGKTTFIKLLCRLYDPTEGEILLNGVNIKKYDYDEYMQIFSVVFQDFKLFAFTLGQNVACAPTYDPKKVEECLKNAGFEDRYKSLPDGAETYLYKRFDKSGIEISGGEAQKIALARALYKDSPFIILDEPTSALDPVSEYEIYSSFNTITGDKTAIYISHRLASCRFCDNIVVFDNGSIIQHGSHESLLSNKNGKYHELWTAQAQYYTK
ncbi:MAG: ABC transporter ATP-binding protein [Clostridia bacterium]|nr:ABC transporter ATP-binding protein [Clostridia bacterium]